MLKKHFDTHKIIVGIVFLLLLLIWVYWGCQKEDLYCDEYYTFATSNSDLGETGLDFAEIQNGSWITPEYFINKYGVDETEILRYDFVWDNQKLDVHPPLYYLLIHFISSFFLGEFSILPGLIVNIACSLVSMLFVYLIFQMLLPGKYTPILAVLACGLNRGFISSIMFIRMWNLVAMFTIILLWIYLAREYKKIGERAFYICLVIINILGMLTQYYFVIICFGFGILYVIYSVYRILKKQDNFKHLFRYVIANIVSAVIYIVLWPTCINHIFFGYRGKEAIENAGNAGSLLSNLKTMYELMDVDIFAGLGIIVILFVTGITISLYIGNKLNKEIVVFLAIGMCAVFYFVVVSQISEIKSERYLYPIYLPVLICVIGCVFSFFYNYQLRGKQVACAVISCSCLLNLFLSPEHLYKGREDRTKMITDYEDQYCLYVGYGTTWYRFCENSFDYMAFDNTKIVFFSDDIPMIKNDEVIEDLSSIIVLIDSQNDIESTIAGVSKNLWDGNCKYTFITDNKRCKAYCFERTY